MEGQPGRKSSIWMQVGVILGLLALGSFAGCGKKEAPISPDLILPGPVGQFRLSQEGESLWLSWVFPRVNQLGQPLSQIEGFRLYRAEVPGASPASGCAPDFVLLADINLEYPKAGRIEGDRAVYRDRDLSPGRCYSYRVAAYGPGGGLGSWSPVLSRAWGVLPQAPASLTARAGDHEVELVWPEVKFLRDGSPIRDLAGYAVYRKTGQGQWQRLNSAPLPAPRYQDVAVTNEVEYTYTIRAVRRLGQYELESLDSPRRTVTPQDLTPPPPPQNLVAVPTARGMELRWEPSPVADLAGYRVYRRRAGEAQPERLTPELVKTAHFVDLQTVPGQTYYYTVTAVDNAKRANESGPSAEAMVADR